MKKSTVYPRKGKLSIHILHSIVLVSRNMNTIPLDERTQKLVTALQLQCLHPGIGALRQLSCMFRRMDLDYSKKICFEEFLLGLKNYNLNFSNEDIQLLFSALDINSDGQIDFREFLTLLIPPMNEVRTNVINEAFDKLDVNGDGTIQLDELKGKEHQLIPC